MPTEIHKRIINALWRGLRTLEVLDELQNPRGFNLNLNDSEELAMEAQINRLRSEIANAREHALGAAERAWRAGKNWDEVIAMLNRPCLLPQIEMVAYAQKALDKIKEA